MLVISEILGNNFTVLEVVWIKKGNNIGKGSHYQNQKSIKKPLNTKMVTQKGVLDIMFTVHETFSVITLHFLK